MMPPDLRATRIRMRCSHLLVTLAAGIGVCAGGPATARDPAAPYLGMSQAEVIACAGEPHSRYESGANKETLIYHYSGAGPVRAAKSDEKKSDEKKSEEKKSEKNKIASIFSKDKKKGDKNWTCSASLVFEGGRLIRVSFSHKDVRSPYQWQSEKDEKKAEQMRKEGVPTCEFSLPNCAR
jgi:hypothetical protein